MVMNISADDYSKSEKNKQMFLKIVIINNK